MPLKLKFMYFFLRVRVKPFDLRDFFSVTYRALLLSLIEQFIVKEQLSPVYFSLCEYVQNTERHEENWFFR